MNLKNEINSSRYSDMFQFETYHGWIKKQISKPLEDILSLLEKNKNVLEKTYEDIAQQIKNTEKIELQAPLKLQNKRVKIQLKQLEEYIPMLEESISKLQ
jgi:bifunctional pyridoxal-dependent enzyme with beta-cystathionase and maltose regulon repressor activities